MSHGRFGLDEQVVDALERFEPVIPVTAYCVQVIGVDPNDDFCLVFYVCEAVVDRLENNLVVLFDLDVDDLLCDPNRKIRDGRVIRPECVLPLTGERVEEFLKPNDLILTLVEALLHALVRAVFESGVIRVFFFLLEALLEFFEPRFDD